MARGDNIPDRDFNLASSNADARGMTADDSNIWVVDETANKVFVYTINGVRVPNMDFNLHANNGHAQGITTDGTNIYIVDDSDDQIFVYSRAGAFVRRMNLDSANTSADGITNDGTNLYVIESRGDKVFAYTLTGTRVASLDFAIADGSSGITTDGEYFYISNTREDKVYVYNLSGVHQSNLDFDFTATNTSPQGISVSDVDLLVADGTANKIFFYEIIETKGRGDVVRDFTLDSDNRTVAGMDIDGSLLYTVDATDDKIFVYSITNPTTVNRLTGREFNLDSNNSNATGLTISGGVIYILDGSDKVFVYSTSGTLRYSFDLDPANTVPDGITSDGTYLYVVDRADRKVYAYSLTGDRQTDKDFTLVAANSSARGITFDGEYFLIPDDASTDKVFVYDTNGGNQSSLEFDFAPHSSNPRGAATDGTILYVAEIDMQVLGFLLVDSSIPVLVIDPPPPTPTLPPAERQFLTLEGIDMTTGNYRFWSPTLFSYEEIGNIVKPHARADGGSFLHGKLLPRRLRLEGYVLGRDRNHAIELVDNLKALLNQHITFGARFPEGERVWDCYIDRFSPQPTPTSVNRIPIAITLIAPNGYAYTPVLSRVFSHKINGNDVDFTLNAPASNYRVVADLTIRINNVGRSFITNPQQIVIRNTVLGTQLELRALLGVGSEIKIDGRDETVLLNGAPIRHSGLFPYLTARNQVLRLTTQDNGLSYTPILRGRYLWT